MRYLIPAAGMARRLGDATGGLPKCLVDIDGEPLIVRLIRQIRANDPAADIHLVLGYRKDVVLPHVEGCRIVLNPFFDVTSVVASLWLARASFDQAVMLIHGDLVLSEALYARLAAAPEPTLIGYDSTILLRHEINVRVAGGKLVGFGEKIDEFHGLYGGVLKLSDDAAPHFRAALEATVERGFNHPNGYYFDIVRSMRSQHAIEFAAFDYAGELWQEVDHAADIAAARARVGRKK
jgi:choline kinase